MAKKKKQERYQITKWKELDNYECTKCPYSTLDKKAIEKHYLDRHVFKIQDYKKVEVKKVDRFGGEVNG